MGHLTSIYPIPIGPYSADAAININIASEAKRTIFSIGKTSIILAKLVSSAVSAKQEPMGMNRRGDCFMTWYTRNDPQSFSETRSPEV